MDPRTATKNTRSWLRHRIAQFLLSSSCTTTATTAAAAAASTALERFSGGNLVHRFKINQPSPTAPAASDFRSRTPPLLQISINFGGAARRSGDSSEPLLLVAAKSDRKNKGRRAVDKHGESSKNRPPAPPSSLPGYVNYQRREKTSQKKKSYGKYDNKRRVVVRLSRNANGFSSSSSFDSENELSLFSCDEDDEDNDDEEESATLFSSKSFSSDSSDFYHCNRKKKKNKQDKKRSSKSMKSTRRPPRRGSNRLQLPSSISSTTMDQGKEDAVAAAAGVAVVKKSRNPYMDFRSSMMEMIAERRLGSRKELERLLQSYLLLNSACHHPAILKAFGDVWEAIFSSLD